MIKVIANISGHMTHRNVWNLVLIELGINITFRSDILHQNLPRVL